MTVRARVWCWIISLPVLFRLIAPLALSVRSSLAAARGPSSQASGWRCVHRRRCRPPSPIVRPNATALPRHPAATDGPHQKKAPKVGRHRVSTATSARKRCRTAASAGGEWSPSTDRSQESTRMPPGRQKKAAVPPRRAVEGSMPRAARSHTPRRQTGVAGRQLFRTCKLGCPGHSRMRIAETAPPPIGRRQSRRPLRGHQRAR